MRALAERFPISSTVLRIALVVFVLAWILGPDELRSAVPIWLVFMIALGLEVNFLLGALRSSPPRRPERAPQLADQERYGYGSDPPELLLVDMGEGPLWVPYSGETEEELEGLIADVHEGQGHEPGVVGDEPRNRWIAVRRFLTGLGVFAVLALLLWFVEGRTGWTSLAGDTRAAATARFSEEASRIAGKQVTIRCDESRDYVGFVQHADGVALVGGDRAYLTPERCYDLYRLAFKGEITSSQTARALAVLAHEAWHLRGVGDEGTTECYALQSGVELGVRLGLEEHRARQMMSQQLVENRLRSAASIEYVVPGECRDGDGLDLDANDGAFP